MFFLSWAIFSPIPILTIKYSDDGNGGFYLSIRKSAVAALVGSPIVLETLAVVGDRFGGGFAISGISKIYCNTATGSC